MATGVENLLYSTSPFFLHRKQVNILRCQGIVSTYLSGMSEPSACTAYSLRNKYLPILKSASGVYTKMYNIAPFCIANHHGSGGHDITIDQSVTREVM